MTIIRHADFPGDTEQTVKIWKDYIGSPSVSLGFQNNEAELSCLPGRYARPQGGVLIAESASTFVGCVAFRPVSAIICEMKKLYVRPTGRGQGLGRRLVAALIIEARAAGYKEVRLDVLEEFEAARGIYADLGFRAAEPVAHNPVPGAQFLGLRI